MRRIGTFLAALVALSILLIPVRSRVGFSGLHWWIPVGLGALFACILLATAGLAAWGRTSGRLQSGSFLWRTLRRLLDTDDAA